jgi:hypothetical protein
MVSESSKKYVRSVLLLTPNNPVLYLNLLLKFYSNIRETKIKVNSILFS